MTESATIIDQKGRVAIPVPILDALGLLPEAEVVISLTNAGVLIKPKNSAPITNRIAAMSLPVAGWEQMETESELGRMQ